MNAERKSGKIVIGAFILIVGSLALIDNLGLFDTRALLAFWPLVFVVFGALKLGQARSNPQRIAGALVMVFGLLFTLSTTGMLHFRLRDWWPALLIAGGTMMLWKGWRERKGGDGGCREFFGQSGASTTPEGHLNAVAVLSGSRLRADAQHLKQGEATAIMGAVVLDLRQAAIDEEARLEIFVLWGAVQILVPGDWVVVSNCAPFLGGVEDKTVPPMNAGKRLVLGGYVVMGGLEIRN
jgi:predicted membrane protein